MLERVQNNGKHLLALINDVLDLAKIEAGQLTLTLEDYALPRWCARSSPRPSRRDVKGAEIHRDVQDDMPMGHGDARRLSQVLLNLVGNAIKFTEPGEVEIRAAAANGQFVLSVREPGRASPTPIRSGSSASSSRSKRGHAKKGGTGSGWRSPNAWSRFRAASSRSNPPWARARPSASIARPCRRHWRRRHERHRCGIASSLRSSQ